MFPCFLCHVDKSSLVLVRAGRILGAMPIPRPMPTNVVCTKLIMLHFLCQLHALKLRLPFYMCIVSFQKVVSQSIVSNLLKYSIHLLMNICIYRVSLSVLEMVFFISLFRTSFWCKLSLVFAKLAELHIVTARKLLIHQNQPVAQYQHKIQPCML